MMSAGSKEIDLQSLDRERLKADAVALQDQIRQLPGVASVTSDVQNVSTAAKVNVDPLKAMANGLTPVQVGMTLNNVLSGAKAVDQLVESLDQIKKSDLQHVTYKASAEQFPVFVWIAVILLVIDAFVMPRKIGWLKRFTFFHRSEK